MVGPDLASLARSSSLWFMSDFRWRDAGPRTREKVPRHPPPPHPYPLPCVPLCPPPSLCRREAAALRGGWSRSPGPGCAWAPLPRWTIGMDRSAFKFAGSGRIHFKRRGRNVDSGGLGVVGSQRLGRYPLGRVEVRSLSGSQVPLIVAVPVGGTNREGVGLGCKQAPR